MMVSKRKSISISHTLMFIISELFIFRESFNLWCPLLLITLYHQTKTLISFWYRRGLNPRSLIQLSEILPIELTGTHHYFQTWLFFDILSINVILSILCTGCMESASHKPVSLWEARSIHPVHMIISLYNLSINSPST